MRGRAGSYPWSAGGGSRLLAAAWRRWLPSLMLAPACLYVLVQRGEVALVDPLNVLIHEAGHLFFFLLGDVFHAAGGTLMQVLLPAFLAWHFWQGGLPLGTQVALLWLGHNALDIGTYAGDAGTQALALMPGRQHDWAHLLGQFDLLAYDATVAYFFSFAAILCFIGTVILPLYYAKTQPEAVPLP